MKTHGAEVQLYSLNSALYWRGVVNAKPWAALVPEVTRYPLYSRLGGPQSSSGRVRKMWPPTGIRLPERPVPSESL
jgi:hypothetical protein